jgi:hypothetical protein
MNLYVTAKKDNGAQINAVCIELSHSTRTGYTARCTTTDTNGTERHYDATGITRKDAYYNALELAFDAATEYPTVEQAARETARSLGFRGTLLVNV